MAARRRGSEGIGDDHSSFDDEFDQVDQLLEEGIDDDQGPKQILGGVKEVLVDPFIYSEVIREIVEDPVESLQEEMGEDVSDEEMLEAIRNGGENGEGEFYERIMQLAIDSDNRGYEDAIDDSIFDNKVEASDAFGIDYILRGGKRLRPFMTLLTEYAITGETSYIGAMTGAGQELIHASSLQHDDDMDNDPLRRSKLSSERINRALYGEDSWKQSVLDGNKVESWGDRAINSIIATDGDGIPKDASDRFFKMEQRLNDGQKRDIEMENRHVSETSLEDYETMIDGKTGALFETGIMMMAETYLSDEEFEEAGDRFHDYASAFNMLFQSGDDAIEVFRPGNSGKTVTDVQNRKLTMPAIVTKDYLQDQHPEYAKQFTAVFDGLYDEVTEEMRDTAKKMHEEAFGREDVQMVYSDPSEMDLTIPEDAEAGGEWEEEWLTHAIRSYGRVASEEVAQQYLEDAYSAVDQLHELGIINEEARDTYREFAEFVWSRDH